MYVCMYVCTYVRMYVCTYVRMYVCTYVCMYVLCMYYVCMYVQNQTVCHTISGLKCCIRRTPPQLLEAQKTWGWYISGGQAKYFSEISCLTPSQIFQG